MPAYHVFGSDELSVLSLGITELSAAPYIAVNPQHSGIFKGQTVEVTLSGKSYQLPVKFSQELAVGLAAIPVGLPSLAVGWSALLVQTGYELKCVK